MKITLYGYFGHENIGDELMLEGLIRNLEQNDKISKIFVFTAKHITQIANYSKIKQVIFSKANLLEVLKSVLYSKYIIWGGGTCLYDSEGITGLKEILKVQWLCKMLFTKYIFLNIGVGKIETKTGRKLISKLLGNSYKIIFRDPFSLQRIHSLYPNQFKHKIYLGNDLIFLLNDQFSQEVNTGLKTKNSFRNISFSGVYNLSDTLESTYSNLLLELISQYNVRIHFMPAHLGQKSDNIFHRKIAANLAEKSYKIYESLNSNEYVSLLHQMDFHIGIRLHSIILADLCSVANLGINYSDKVKYYLAYDKNIKRVFALGEGIRPEEIKNIFDNYSTQSDYFQNLKREVEDSISKALR